MTVSAGATQEMVVEAGKVHDIAVDYSFKFGNASDMSLRPVGPSEGEQILARCSKTKRF